MTKILEIPIAEVDYRKIQALKEKYPNATLSVEAEVDMNGQDMDEDQFWAIIDLLDWDKAESVEVLRPAKEALSKFPKSGICRFFDIMNEKLYALDGKRYAEQRYDLKDDEAYFSVDDFLYARCAVVANGRTFFEEILERPEQIPKEFSFESLLYLPTEAWQLKTGEKELDYFPETWYETFSNPEGWPGVKTIKERILDSRK